MQFGGGERKNQGSLALEPGICEQNVTKYDKMRATYSNMLPNYDEMLQNVTKHIKCGNTCALETKYHKTY